MTAHELPSRLFELTGLRRWCEENGFEIEEVGHDELLLVDQSTGSSWSLFRVEDWLQVKGLVLDDIEPTLGLCLTLARLHDRLLGCRFSIDPQHGVVLIGDFPTSCQSSDAIGETVLQMQSIIDQTTSLLERVVESGEAASEMAIDHAFGMDGSRRVH